MYIKSSKLYNNFLEIHYDEYNELSDATKINLGDNYDPECLFLKEESTNKEQSVDISDMTPLEGNEEEVKEGKGILILTLNIISNIVSTNKTCNQFIQTKKLNQTNTVSYVSAQ